MSRIGRKPVEIPAGVEVKTDGTQLSPLRDRKVLLPLPLTGRMTVKVEGSEILVTRPTDDKDDRALHGLTRTLVHNMVIGVTEGYKKELEVNGVGHPVLRSRVRTSL